MASTGGVALSALADLIATTTANFDKLSYEAMSKYANYATSKLFAAGKVTADGGYRIERKVRTGSNGSAEVVKTDDVTNVARTEVMATSSAEWVRTQAYWVADTVEVAMNTSASRLVDLVKTKRNAALASLAELLEDKFWATPVAGHPNGIKSFIVPATGAQVAAGESGFQGGANVLGNTVSGIDVTAVTNWKNYNDVWSNATGAIASADMAKLNSMYRRLAFQTPIHVEDIKAEKFSNQVIFANDKVIGSLEETMRVNNDDVGFDVGKFAGATSFKNIPIVYINQLDTDTSNPLYMVNLDHIATFALKGFEFLESEGMKDNTKHNQLVYYIDTVYNHICLNRQRAGGVISSVAAST